jgi:hypothetical protein
MLSGYMTGPACAGTQQTAGFFFGLSVFRPANTKINKERITELRYTGRAPFKRRPRSTASSLVGFSRRSRIRNFRQPEIGLSSWLVEANLDDGNTATLGSLQSTVLSDELQ